LIVLKVDFGKSKMGGVGRKGFILEAFYPFLFFSHFGVLFNFNSQNG